MGLFRRKRTPEDGVETDEVVDLTDAAERRPRLHAGVPGRCPLCDGFGYIDNIDMVNRHQRQHCRDCGHSWEFDFDEDGEMVGELTSEIDLRHGATSAATDPWSIDA